MESLYASFYQKREAKAICEDAAVLSEALKAKKSEYKRERQDFTETVGMPERKPGKKL